MVGSELSPMQKKKAVSEVRRKDAGKKNGMGEKDVPGRRTE